MYVDHNKVGEQAEITHVILQLTSNKLHGSRQSLIQTCVVITTIQQGPVCSKKYSLIRNNLS